MLNFDYIYNFLGKVEGCELKAYVPNNRGTVIANSGVTVGLGVDLGQTNAKELASLGIEEKLIAKLAFYLGKTKQDAQNSLLVAPLALDKKEIESLSKAKIKQFCQIAKDRFNQHGRDWEQACKEEQAVCVSLLYHFGGKSCPSTIGKIARGETARAIEELLDSKAWGKVYYANRRKMEAHELGGL